MGALIGILGPKEEIHAPGWRRPRWNRKNVTEMLYGIPVRVLSAASWLHWSGMLLVSYYDHSGCKKAAGRNPMTHT